MSVIKNLHDRTIFKENLHNDVDKFLKMNHKIRNFVRPLTWIEELWNIENAIGGIGAHNVNRIMIDERRKTVTGTYKVEERPIFRAIQYCTMALITSDFVMDTRYLTFNSCLHIEGIMKYLVKKIGVRNKSHFPLGRILSENSVVNRFTGNEFGLIKSCRLINNIFVNAKHRVSIDSTQYDSDALNWDVHLFSYQDAIETYFACRIVACRLLEWLKMQNIAPFSYINIPQIGHDEYLKIALRKIQ